MCRIPWRPRYGIFYIGRKRSPATYRRIDLALTEEPALFLERIGTEMAGNKARWGETSRMSN
jgi:hypothetical protein